MRATSVLRLIGSTLGVIALTTSFVLGAPEAKDKPKPKAKPAVPAVPAETAGLLEKFRAGPMAGVDEIVFATRRILHEHWYANFSYYAYDDGQTPMGNGRKLYLEGAKLCRLNLKDRSVSVVLEDPKGGIRDPQLDYAAKKILFSYRKDGSEHYHLYEINIDGKGLRQLTDGDYDDIEPSYLASGDIVFVSSRCKRWVNCWLSQVAVLHRCDANGGNIRAISSNNEHDNTPWPLPDGRILYTRWEYVDRSQVHYHHLWSANPDGSAQTVYYGNLNPGVVMIDAKPIPGTDKIVASFSPGHGKTEHEGQITVVDPTAGPDALAFAKKISKGNQFRDPWAFSEDCFLAATGPSLVVMNGAGEMETIFKLSDEEAKGDYWCHEPRPLKSRPREARIADHFRPDQASGRMLLANVYDGRNMEGVKPGEIKKLLVLETLPKPINYTGGMEPLSYGGTFTLERIVGTVPVEADGSAYFEVPPLRSLFFVAMDEKDFSIKRMQSFCTVQPGETVSCVGCHEHRVRTPAANSPLALLASQRPPSKIEPVAGVPDVFDFPRDIQPILDRHCVQCHNPDKREAGVNLTGDHGPLYSISYVMLTIHHQVADGRNQPKSNYPPRALGSSASALMKKIDGSHHAVKVSAAEEKLIRFWIESGAPYPGTYAALGSGMVGGHYHNKTDHSLNDLPATRVGIETIHQRCGGCHSAEHHQVPASACQDVKGYSRHLIYDLTRPEKSSLLMAPLAVAAGGYGACKTNVFTSTSDADYVKILTAVTAAKKDLEEIKRFDMPGFRPRIEWIREMTRYGILPATLGPNDPINVYAVERKYWESLWYIAKPSLAVNKP